ncbi:MAG TPA: radical SAM protein [Candidatus Sumerlaeota bacterium]|nr:radical SAM protein [Candidatus Sumerlaeota bacterium]
MKTIALITVYNPGCAGLRYIAGSLKAAGHDVHIISFKELRSESIPSADKEHHARLQGNRDVLFVKFPFPGKSVYVPYPTAITEKEKEILVETLRDSIKPDLIGFSLYSVTYEICRQLTSYIREHLPGIPIIWGGLHCIMAPHECIDTADIVCTGEGEDATVELMQRWEEYIRKGRLDIAGLWFRTRMGEIVKNPERPLIEDLNRLPYPVYGEKEILIEDDAANDKMNRPGPFLNAHVYTFTERGCPYKCSYCIHSLLNREGHARFRRRSVDNVMGEVRDLVERLGMRHLVFHDEIFVIDKKWITEFADKFREQFHKPHGCTFTGYVHPLTTTPEILDMMFHAGHTRVGMGIQSGSGRVNTDIFDRKWCPKETIEMARLLSRYDFETIQYDLIVNNPFETEEDMRQTFEFLMNFPPPFSPVLFGLVVYKYSTLSQRPLPENPPDAGTNLFYNMLYHLTGSRILSRPTIEALSRDPHLRREPELLESLALDITNAETSLNEARRQAGHMKDEIGRMEAWIKEHEPENYALKDALKSKFKRLLFPLVKDREEQR